METQQTFPIRFDSTYAALSKALLLPPSSSSLEIEGDDVVVKMGWAFSARFPRSAVMRVSMVSTTPISRGVHGWNGVWLVNGAGDRIIGIDLQPGQRAKVMGVPVKLARLKVSVDDPAALSAALMGRTSGSA